MSTYEVRFYDGKDRLSRVRTEQHQNDDAALERLAAERHRHALELWRAGHVIWRFEPIR